MTSVSGTASRWDRSRAATPPGVGVERHVQTEVLGHLLDYVDPLADAHRREDQIVSVQLVQQSLEKLQRLVAVGTSRAEEHQQADFASHVGVGKQAAFQPAHAEVGDGRPQPEFGPQRMTVLGEVQQATDLGFVNRVVVGALDLQTAEPAQDVALGIHGVEAGATGRGAQFARDRSPRIQHDREVDAVRLDGLLGLGRVHADRHTQKDNVGCAGVGGQTADDGCDAFDIRVRGGEHPDERSPAEQLIAAAGAASQQRRREARQQRAAALRRFGGAQRPQPGEEPRGQGQSPQGGPPPANPLFPPRPGSHGPSRPRW